MTSGASSSSSSSPSSSSLPPSTTSSVPTGFSSSRTKGGGRSRNSALTSSASSLASHSSSSSSSSLPPPPITTTTTTTTAAAAAATTMAMTMAMMNTDPGSTPTTTTTTSSDSGVSLSSSPPRSSSSSSSSSLSSSSSSSSSLSSYSSASSSGLNNTGGPGLLDGSQNPGPSLSLPSHSSASTSAAFPPVKVGKRSKSATPRQSLLLPRAVSTKAEVKEAISGVAPIPFVMKDSVPEDDVRPHRYLPKANENTRARISRALNERLFLISRRDKKELSETFVVLGSTGNVYDVTVASKHVCSCPDYHKPGNTGICKHILFVLLKVLRLKNSSYLLHQCALTNNEVRALFECAPEPLSTALADPAVISSYRSALLGEGEDDDQHKVIAVDVGLRPISEEDTCPICFDELLGALPREACFSCKNWIHKECIGLWMQAKKSSGDDVTCPYCRGQWSAPAPEPVGPRGVPMSEGYVNLGQFQPGHSKTRDTDSHASKSWSWRRNYFDDFDEFY